MLLVFTGERIKRIRGDVDIMDESKFRSASFLGMVLLADIMMEGELEAESESLERVSSLLLKFDRGITYVSKPYLKIYQTSNFIDTRSH